MLSRMKHGQNVTSRFVWIVNIPVHGSSQKYRFISKQSDVVPESKRIAFITRPHHHVVVLIRK